MDNGSGILKALDSDVLSSLSNQIIDKSDTDLIRRRRLEHLENKATSSLSINTEHDKGSTDT